MQLSEVTVNEENRARILTQVTTACPDGSQNTGEITLDSVASNVPWRHWKITQSTFGGTLANPWCE